MEGAMSRPRSMSEIELAKVLDEDREAVRGLYKSIRVLRDDVRVNVHQAKLLAFRVNVALSTVLKMPHARMSPQMVSVVRSVHYLLKCLSDDEESWRFLLLHFTARNIFRSVRQRFVKVWSLQSTTGYDVEDNKAAELDDRENFEKLTSRARQLDARVPLHVLEMLHDEQALISFYRRRSNISGWKLPFGQLEFGPEVTRLPCAVLGVCPEAREPTRIDPTNVRGLFIEHSGDPESRPGDYVRFHGTDVNILEVPPGECDPADMEPFIVDVVHRFGWWHPSLTHVLGAYTEAIGQDGNAFLVLGLVEEDLARKGYTRLDHVIFDRGQRISLHAAVTIALKVSEAMQYARFDAYDVVENCPNAWASVPLSSVYTRPAITGSHDEVGTRWSTSPARRTST
jgi:hypothetical protein